MRVLELFKGTGSVSKLLELSGHEVISLDILKKFNPTHNCDILDFDYKQYPPKHFDVIWASPECKVYSQLQTTNVGPTRKFKTREDLDTVRRENSQWLGRRARQESRYRIPEGLLQYLFAKHLSHSENLE